MGVVKRSTRAPALIENINRLCLVLALAPLSGCLNAEAMIQSRRVTTVRQSLVEVDLGEVCVTLPRPAKGANVAEFRVHAFGRVSDRDRDHVVQAIETHGPELRHRLLLAVRQLSMEHFEEPDLQTLRTQIIEVVNGAILEEPLQSVGFYSLTYSNI